ncbi:MAG: CYTH domain-containing protein [bacterium]|nr:CYTH domain-containing protein [bacterium]
MNSLGQTIKLLRKNSGLTQAQLADKLFVSSKTISSWELDRTYPDLNMILSISSVMNISIYSLIDPNYYNFMPILLEVKLKINKTLYNNLLNKIKNVCKNVIEVRQIDTYYTPTYKKFSNEWLRIRVENNKNILTYKKKIKDNEFNLYESIFDNYKNLENIIINLGFKNSGKIIKQRIKMNYKDKYEISFDEVENIGNFIEFKVMKITDNYAVEINNLIDLLKSFDIDLKLIDTKKYFDYL